MTKKERKNSTKNNSEEVDILEQYVNMYPDTNVYIKNIDRSKKSKIAEFLEILYRYIDADTIINRLDHEGYKFGMVECLENHSHKQKEYGQVVQEAMPKSAMPPEYESDEMVSVKDAFYEYVVNDSPDSVILRYLREADWDADLAMNRLLDTLAWRTKSKIDELNWYGESIANLRYMQRGVAIINGRDKLGRPIVYINLSRIYPSEQTLLANLAGTILTMERARSYLTRDIQKVCLIVDVKEMSSKNYDITYYRLFLRFLCNYYPECLGAVLVYSESWLFRGVWLVAKNYIHANVVAKVRFVKNFKELSLYIDKEELLEKYGGENSYDFKYVIPTEDENVHMYDRKGAEEVKNKYIDSLSTYLDNLKRWASEEYDTDEEENAMDRLEAEVVDFLEVNRTYKKYIVAKTIKERVL
ncbi:CRAL-TRIO domain-containing protein [Zancudomyces culisetae]|uniref:CRAL-TRIO domain-containing protein n=1 Tax=Zancudomyces culisetae TaxID=1213189 RepID=A0A1R1PTI1_ZANCU|nr:CRAL-TRIO domain-containing protein [Zancudomyces culisetae]|eukprot:OMH84257.1 CRAL-TRIO domain-containing protein [Zancudomyces culisetae]